jgi:hypothetical protein
MRHETCLLCRVPGVIDLNVRQIILLTESVAPAAFMHHHHLMNCGGCGQWWFDDLVIGGLGIPVPSRRDTELCPCDENLKQYAQSAVNVPVPEAECACTKADVDRFSIHMPAGKPGTGTVHHREAVSRADAISDISAHIADQDAFVISVPPGALEVVTHRLRNLRGTTCYLDIEGACGDVTRFRSPHLTEAANIAKSQPPDTAVAVFIVPKTIPAARLSKLLGSELHGQVIPADGSQDLVMIQTRDLFDMPRLLIDAIAVHDPRSAAEMYANDLRNQS